MPAWQWRLVGQQSWWAAASRCRQRRLQTSDSTSTTACANGKCIAELYRPSTISARDFPGRSVNRFPRRSQLGNGELLTLSRFSCCGSGVGVGGDAGVARGCEAALRAKGELSGLVVADFLERRSESSPSGRPLRVLMMLMALACVVSISCWSGLAEERQFSDVSCPILQCRQGEWVGVQVGCGQVCRQQGVGEQESEGLDELVVAPDAGLDLSVPAEQRPLAAGHPADEPPQELLAALQVERALALEPVVLEVPAVAHPPRQRRGLPSKGLGRLLRLPAVHCGGVPDLALAAEFVGLPLPAVDLSLVEAENSVAVTEVVAEFALVGESGGVVEGAPAVALPGLVGAVVPQLGLPGAHVELVVVVDVPQHLADHPLAVALGDGLARGAGLVPGVLGVLGVLGAVLAGGGGEALVEGASELLEEHLAAGLAFLFVVGDVLEGAALPGGALSPRLHAQRQRLVLPLLADRVDALREVAHLEQLLELREGGDGAGGGGGGRLLGRPAAGQPELLGGLAVEGGRVLLLLLDADELVGGPLLPVAAGAAHQRPLRLLLDHLQSSEGAWRRLLPLLLRPLLVRSLLCGVVQGRYGLHLHQHLQSLHFLPEIGDHAMLPLDLAVEAADLCLAFRPYSSHHFREELLHATHLGCELRAVGFERIVQLLVELGAEGGEQLAGCADVGLGLLGSFLVVAVLRDLALEVDYEVVDVKHNVHYTASIVGTLQIPKKRPFRHSSTFFGQSVGVGCSQCWRGLRLFYYMIVRGNLTPSRTASRVKGEEHRSLLVRIADLQRENRELRGQVLLMEQRLLEAATAKRKYKAKYREARQQLDILAIAGQGQRDREGLERCFSPRTKATRIQTFSSEEFNSVRVGRGSEFGEAIETRVEIDHFPSPVRPPGTASSGRPGEEKIMEGLLRLHGQLDKLSQEIERRPAVERRVGELEEQLYRRMEEVVDKVARMETRDIERENRRITHEKEVAARKYNASVKSVESIGKDLAEFRVAP